MNHIIEIERLSKHFDHVVAVDNISFSVMQGEFFAFLGTNGAGKSTTINMICTLLKKTSGTIRVDGFDTEKDAAAVRRCLGVVFQNNVLDDLLTVSDNLKTRARFQGLHGNRLSSRLDEIRTAFELTDIWKRPFGKLSGGQKRKCEIARAILCEPKVLILDEPTTGLDPQTRTLIWDLIRKMRTPLKKCSLTADDGASSPAEWCTHFGEMVHGGRGRGAPGHHAGNYSGMPLRLRMDSPSIWMV